MMQKLLIFGMGYVSSHLASVLKDRFEIAGTSREAKPNNIIWDGLSFNDEIANKLKQADAVLISIPPNEQGDLAFAQYGDVIKKSNIKWIGYLSTTGVYGDHQGGIVDENTPLNAQNDRAKRRILAEDQWQSISSVQRAINIFRLPGIYGVGRSVFEALKTGRAKRIDMRLENGDKHFFCRVHVDDIVQVLVASLTQNLVGINVYNIVDDKAAPNAEVIEYAAKLMQVTTPALLSAKDAQISEMAKSFYRECKNLQNDKIKQALNVSLIHPTYEQGLTAIWHKLQT